MELVCVEAHFPAEAMERAREALTGQLAAVRAIPGNESYELFIAPTSVAIVQRWESFQSFEAYRASPAFAQLGQALKPLMSAPPRTTIATIHTQ